jgi:hypothetical protein
MRNTDLDDKKLKFIHEKIEVKDMKKIGKNDENKTKH